MIADASPNRSLPRFRRIDQFMDQDAFARALADAYPRLWLVAVACCQDRVQAEDIVQDAVMAALGRLSDFQRGTNFQAWMATFVRNVARNHRRKSTRRETVAVDPQALEQQSGGGWPSNSGGGENQRALGSITSLDEAFDDQLLDAMRRLTRDARMCLLLRTVEEMSYAEIAAILQIPEGTAMSHVHRAKQSLRESLVEFGHPQAVRQ